MVMAEVGRMGCYLMSFARWKVLKIYDSDDYKII
jgi:hypothetical protein